MLYLYLDESGDLGFDFVNKRPSLFFTICILVIEGAENRKRITKMIERTLRRKLNPKNKRKRIVQELKAASTTLDIKNYFYRNVKDINFSIYSLTLNKKRVYSNLISDKSRIYNWVARILLDQINFCNAHNQVNLIIDKSKSKPEIAEFDKYIFGNIKSKIDPKIPLNIMHKDSKEDFCLNAVDLFSWGIFRKYEKKDKSWYDIYKDKIVYEDLYLK